ncbi:MAG: cytochrome C oxidase subunit IV family protein [Salegentibacter sp.]
MAQAVAHKHHHKQHESHAKRYLIAFAILSVVTIIEVLFGIFRPAILNDTMFVGMRLLNWVFITLTLYKAYLITWAFMHMELESKGLRRAVVWTGLFLVSYLIFILLTEGDYQHEVLTNGYVTWDF